MPKPFPLPLGIGTDVCQTSRIARALQKYPSRFKSRLLSLKEREAYVERLRIKLKMEGMGDVGGGQHTDDGKGNWVAKAGEAEGKRAAEFLAGRWAAKEAIIKAWSSSGSVRKIGFGDIAILPRGWAESLSPFRAGRVSAIQSGPPMAVVLAKKERKDGKGVEWMERWERGHEVKVSISHDAGVAIAVAMVWNHDLFSPSGSATPSTKPSHETKLPSGPPRIRLLPSDPTTPHAQTLSSREERRQSVMRRRGYRIVRFIRPSRPSLRVRKTDTVRIRNVAQDLTSAQAVALSQARERKNNALTTHSTRSSRIRIRRLESKMKELQIRRLNVSLMPETEERIRNAKSLLEKQRADEWKKRLEIVEKRNVNIDRREAVEGVIGRLLSGRFAPLYRGEEECESDLEAEGKEEETGWIEWDEDELSSPEVNKQNVVEEREREEDGDMPASEKAEMEKMLNEALAELGHEPEDEVEMPTSSQERWAPNEVEEDEGTKSLMARRVAEVVAALPESGDRRRWKKKAVDKNAGDGDMWPLRREQENEVQVPLSLSSLIPSSTPGGDEEEMKALMARRVAEVFSDVPASGEGKRRKKKPVDEYVEDGGDMWQLGSSPLPKTSQLSDPVDPDVSAAMEVEEKEEMEASSPSTQSLLPEPTKKTLTPRQLRRRSRSSSTPTRTAWDKVLTLSNLPLTPSPPQPTPSEPQPSIRFSNHNAQKHGARTVTLDTLVRQPKPPVQGYSVGLAGKGIMFYGNEEGRQVAREKALRLMRRGRRRTGGGRWWE